MAHLRGLKVAVLLADGFDQDELNEPCQRLEDAGAQIELVAPQRGEVRAWNRTGWGTNVTADLALTEAQASTFDALLIPGGLMSIDALRGTEDAVDFVAAFLREKKPVAAMCHAPLLLAEAGALRGRRVTSYKTIRTDLVNAGAYWSDEEVVTDRLLVTSRSGGDLPAFIRKTVQVFAESMRPRERDAHETQILPN